MTPKEIGRRAGDIFNYFKPSNWAYRSQEDQEDYGVDAELELIDNNDHATGFIFKVQLKGQKNVKLLADGKTASFCIDTNRINYYLHNLEIPIILIVVDVTKELVFWTSLQDNKTIAEDLKAAQKAKQTSMTIHMPLNHTFETESFLKAVETNMDWIRLNSFRNMGDVTEVLKQNSIEDMEKLLAQEQKRNTLLKSNLFQKLWVSGEDEKLFEQTDKVMDSPTESSKLRVCAGLYLEKLAHRQAAEPLDKITLGIYTKLFHIIRPRGEPYHLKLYVVFMYRQFFLNDCVKADFHSCLSHKMTVNDPLFNFITSYAANRFAIDTGKHVTKTILLVNRFFKNDYYLIIPTLTQRIIPTLCTYYQRLILDEQHDNAAIVIEWMEKIVEIAINIAMLNKDYRDACSNMQLKMLMKTSDMGWDDLYSKVQSEMKTIPNEAIKLEYLKKLNSMYQELKSYSQPQSPEQQLKVIEIHARGLGYDPDDPNNRFGQIIKQGLKDYNPERVMKYCKNLMVFPGSLGLPAKQVGLWSAGSKNLVCLKHGYEIGGWDLDEIFEGSITGFKNEYCESCIDRCKRDSDWEWNINWHSEQLELHQSKRHQDEV